MNHQILKPIFCLTLALSCSGCAWQLKPSSRPWNEDSRPQKFPQKQTQTPAKHPKTGADPVPHGPGSSIVRTAQKYLGLPYQWGGESPSTGFDCSGFVQYVYAQNGILLKRLANHQFLQGRSVSQGELQSGDLVFFSQGEIVDHVGIYVGDRQFIHSPRTGRNVSYDSLDLDYYRRNFRGARRIL